VERGLVKLHRASFKSRFAGTNTAFPLQKPPSGWMGILDRAATSIFSGGAFDEVRDICHYNIARAT